MIDLALSQWVFQLTRLFIGAALMTSTSVQALPAFAGYKYGAYNLYSQGTGQAIAMGGANTALSRGVSDVTYNPAGMALGDWDYDINAALTRTTNQAAEREGVDREDDRIPVDYVQGGAAVRWDDWVMAFGVSVPYADQLEPSSYSSEPRASLNIINGDVTLARSWKDSFAVGVSYHYERLDFSYQDSSGGGSGSPIKIEEDVSSGYPSLGLLYDAGKSAIGLSYNPRREYAVDPSANAAHSSVEFLSDVIIPARTRLGLLARPKKRWLITLDFEWIESLEGENVKAFGPDVTSFRSNTSPLVLDTEEKAIMRLGTEWAVVQSRGTDVTLRGGFYTEPSRFVGGEERHHYTFGIEVRFGPAILSVSFDQADEFNNTAQSLTVAWGSL